MKVTLTIQNDTDASIADRYECICANKQNKYKLNCIDCRGTGIVYILRSKWSASITETNFRFFWSFLGLDLEDTYGEIDGRDLKNRIKNLTPVCVANQLCLSRARFDNCDNTETYLSDNFKFLLDYAEEAIKREEKLIWYCFT